MPHRNIVLIGFMGVGKTLVSKKLAQALSRERVSMDEVLEAREQRSISDIFSELGEPYFRMIEAEIVAELASRMDLVIDCGGGVVLNESNISNLRRSGTLFYLKASPRVIYKRIKDEGGRPILDVPQPFGKITELLTQRDPLYRQANYTIDVDDLSVDDIVREIIALSGKE